MQYRRKSRVSLEYILHYVVMGQGGVVFARADEEDATSLFVCDEAYQGLAVLVTAVRGAWAAEEVLVSIHT